MSKCLLEEDRAFNSFIGVYVANSVPSSRSAILQNDSCRPHLMRKFDVFRFWSWLIWSLLLLTVGWKSCIRQAQKILYWSSMRSSIAVYAACCHPKTFKFRFISGIDLRNGWELINALWAIFLDTFLSHSVLPKRWNTIFSPFFPACKWVGECFISSGLHALKMITSE